MEREIIGDGVYAMGGIDNGVPIQGEDGVFVSGGNGEEEVKDGKVLEEKMVEGPLN